MLLENIMDQEGLFKLLELSIKEEQYYLSNFHKELSLLWSIVSAIVAGLTLGLFKVQKPEHFLFLILVPILLFVILNYTKKVLFRSYQRFLECISNRAKIEQLLGLHKTDTMNEKQYWLNEPLIPTRYIESRSNFSSSSEFISHYSKKGVYSSYSKSLTIMQFICGIIIVMLILLFFYEITA